jgi:hypothetical protein
MVRIENWLHGEVIVEEISYLLWNANGSLSFSQESGNGSIQSHLKPIYILTLYFFNICFNIVSVFRTEVKGLQIILRILTQMDIFF